MKTTLLLILLLVGWNVGAQTTDTTTQQQEGIIFMENQPWKSVLQKAKEQNRLIFMDCYTVWCGPCKGLSQDRQLRKCQVRHGARRWQNAVRKIQTAYHWFPHPPFN